MEVWKDIIGFEGIYSISNMGRVRRDKIGYGTYIGKILAGCPTTKGYCRVDLFKDGIFYNFKIHRLVALHFIGPRPEGYQINHKDGIKSNNHDSNLEYLTPKDNKKHAMENGLSSVPHGIEHGMVKLNDSKVLEIRSKYSTGKYTQTQLSIEYNVSRTLIYKIISNRLWKHLLVASQGEGLNHGH